MILKNATIEGYVIGVPGDGVVLNYVNRARGRIQKNRSPTLTTGGGNNTGVVIMNEEKETIRKLTERECMRLMGYTDDEIDKIIGVFSKSTIYQFAGNSVVVDCFAAITNEILKDMDGKTVTLGDFII